MSRLLLFLFLLGLSACTDRVTEQQARVVAEDYDAFWLWAGVVPPPELERAKTIYLLAGEKRVDASTRITPLRATPQEITHADIWLVLRVETLDWSATNHTELIKLVGSWEAGGNRLIGVQIDFDANTRQLDQYATFLRDLRQRLPEKYELGITGLLDWSANGDPAQLVELADVVDETVFQVYQGRETIQGYEKWLMRLDALPMPFRIGLVQGGKWREPDALPDNRNFRGYVVFLVNERAD